MKIESKLSELLPILKKEIDNFDKKFGFIVMGGRWTKKRAFNLLLLEHYQDILLLFQRILQNLDELKAVLEQNKNFHKHVELRKFLTLDVKNLYFLTALINSIFNRVKPIKIYDEDLQRIANIRHELIVHIIDENKSHIFLKPPFRFRTSFDYSPKDEKFEVDYFPYNPPKKWICELDELVTESSKFIPELSDTLTYPDQVKVLYRFTYKITDSVLKRKVRQFVYKSGVQTDPLNVICYVLIKTLKKHRKENYSITKKL